MSDIPLRAFTAPGADAGDVPGPPADPDLDVPAASDLDAIRDELTAPLPEAERVVTLPVATRPGYSIRFSTELAHEQLDAWTRKCRDPKSLVGYDELRLACIILGNQCEAILRQGEPITSAGADLTFAHPAWLKLVAKPSAVPGIRAFYGRDALVIATGRKVLDAAGYGDQVAALEAGDDVDPTPA